MEKDTQDTLVRAYARLQGLRDNIAELDAVSVEDAYVNEYYAALDMLQEIGINTADFHVPDSEIKPRVTSRSREHISYSDQKYILKALLLAKLDAILIYFQVKYDKPRKVGFSPSGKG